MKNILSFLLLITCVLSNAFSKSIHLPKDVQMEILLDSIDTKLVGNDVYMDVWERLWIKSNRDLLCFDFMADSLDVNFVSLETSSKINDICWLDNGDMLVASDSALLLLDDEGYETISYFPYSKMKITPADSHSVYVFGETGTKGIYDISLLDLSGEFTRLFTLTEEVKGIAGNGDISIVALNKELLLFSRKVEPTVFYRTNGEIRSIAITNFGSIFIATSQGLVYFENLERAYTFCNVGVTKLWNINNKLYALFDDGIFALIHQVENFKDFTKDVSE